MFFSEFHAVQMTSRKTWLKSHFHEASEDLARLFSDSGFDLKNKRLLDVGTGDGLIAAGLVARTGSYVTGIDLLEVNKANLADSLPRKYRKKLESNLSFEKVLENRWGFPDSYFDGIFSWSAAEHFENSQAAYSEVWRVLAPSGIFVLQTYPLWKSRWGHHLDLWLPEYFHLGRSDVEIESALFNLESSLRPVELSSGRCSSDLNEILFDKSWSRSEWVQRCMNTYKSLNKIGASEILEALRVSGFEVRRLEIVTLPTFLPSALENQNLLDFGIEGLKLVCVPLGKS